MAARAHGDRPLRVLLATRGSAGHVLPLAPFGVACARAGHEVTVAAQRQHRPNVERTGLGFAPLDDPPDAEWMPLLAEFATRDVATAHAVQVGRFFGEIDVRAALPGLHAAVDRIAPDVIVRDVWEFASTVVAEAGGVPLARVGLGLVAMDDEAARLTAQALGPVRAAAGLPADPAGARMRAGPYLTMMPAALEDPAVPPPADVHRFRAPLPDATPPDPWPGDDRPLVYLTLGSVAGLAHLPYFPALYRAAIDALAPLPVRLLVTVGAGGDPAAIGPVPPNVRVERWVDHDAVAAHAAVVVCHGGYGSLLGSLARGVPLVVLPLFSGDQWANAAAVARAGAGIALDGDRATRTVFGLPASGVLGDLPGSVGAILDGDEVRRAAEAVAAEMRALPTVESAAGLIAAIATEADRAGG